MPGPNAELLRRMLEAFGAEGVEGALRHLHPEIAWHAPPEWLEQRVYIGHEGLRELAAYWTQNFEEYRLDLERVIELDDDRAVALVHQRGRIKGSAAPVELPVGYVAETRDGKLFRVDVFFSWEAALEAAGVDG